MYKNVPSDIKQFRLDATLHKIHKEGIQRSDFGMDSTSELLDNSFGIYSSADLKKRIGPVKTEYFRVALIRTGAANIDIGLEQFRPVRNSMIFGFPGQIFSLYNITRDFFNYYILFSENFIEDTPLLKNYRQQFPFFTYSGVQFLQLTEQAAGEIENFILKINDEVKSRKPQVRQAVQLYLQLILIHAQRNYGDAILSKQGAGETGEHVFNRFIKLVSEHFLKRHKVADYARMLHVSADHLNRTIKTHSSKTAHELIDEMILIESKSYLMHSALSIAEIAYKLNFSDPSHFNKFFKKQAGCTPQQYRSKSE